MVILFLLLLVSSSARVLLAAIISQSTLSSCNSGDSTEPAADGELCKSKIVVAMTLAGEQV